MKKRLPQSIRKFIRREKARIRREVLNIKKQEELISQLYQRFLKQSLNKLKKKEQKYESSRNFQSGNKKGNRS